MRRDQRHILQARLKSPAPSLFKPYRIYGISVLLAAVLLVVLPSYFIASAADGDLDATFGAGGKVTTSFPGGLDTANDVAVQSDGKIVVAGASGTDFALTRYNTDGSLDNTFGTGGRVNTDFPTGLGGFAYAMVIQADGKIVLAGSASESATSFNSVFALVRYNTNGTLDTTFDGDGRVITTFTGASATARALALQPDGKLVAAGLSSDSTTFNSVFALARYNTDGSLDASFDGDGRVITDVPGLTFEEAHAVAIQSNGKIVAAGLGSSAFLLTRYNTDGSLDSGAAGDLTPADSFGTGGIVTTAFGGTFEEANAVAIQTDGKIVAAGATARSIASEDNFALARYNTDGSLDSGAAGDLTPGDSFGTGGKVTTDFTLVDAARDVRIQSDGKIVAAGSAGTIAGGSFFALARYDTAGALDASFDTDGKVTTDFSGGRFGLGAQGVALQTNGRIIAAGDANITGQRDFGVARYNTDGSLDSGAAGDLTPADSFGAGGKVITDFPLNEDAITALLVQTNGKIIAVGRNELTVRISQAQDPNFQLARYNTDGSLDTANFGTGGIVQTDFASNSDDFANAAALQTDGKIVVVGQTGAHFSQIPSANTSFGVARYNTDGSPDPTFDIDGKVTTDFGATHDTANAVVIQTDGKIVVAGTNGSDFILARYNTNGSLDDGTVNDTTPADIFGTAGRVTTDFNSTLDSANALIVQPDGKIVAAGSSSGDFALARYNTDGSLDTANFGTGGKVTTDFNADTDSINGLVRQSDGKLLAAGFATMPGTGSDFALARYNTDGTLDTTGFGTGGKVTTDFGGFDTAADIALQSDGRIVVAGRFFPTSVTTGPAAFFALARYETNGTPVASFGTGGKLTTDFFGVDNQANAVAIQSDGRIVAGGYADTGSSRDFALARYLSAVVTTPPTTVQFSQASFNVQEDCTALPVNVTRTGDTSAATTVSYQTVDGTASQRMDYNLALGRLTFAPGETQKTISLLINEDSKVEGTEQFTISLSNPSGGSLGAPSTATIQITDDVAESAGNPLDDIPVFVCQQYHDFLNREPDSAGFVGWQNILNNCQAGDTRCDRIEVSSAFFRSDEFQVRGYFLYRFYSVALGRKPQYLEFMMDLSYTTGFLTEQQLEAEKVAFINEFMSRQEFKNKYDSQTDPAAYVNLLEQTAGVTLSNKQALINDLTQGLKTRAQVLRAIVESQEVTVKFYKEAFVVEEYFGYLRRDPDALYLDWIQTFNQTNDYRQLVNGFINSLEYRQRFGP